MKSGAVFAGGEYCPFFCGGIATLFSKCGKKRFLFAWEDRMEVVSNSREECLALIREKYKALQEAGEDRYPCRADFSEEEVVSIKAFFGPWPRALEAAGVKPPRDGDRLEKNREKRIRAKRERNARLREEKKEKKR
jgi:hypothetical protein